MEKKIGLTISSRELLVVSKAIAPGKVSLTEKGSVR
jgi:hypothetical protein